VAYELIMLLITGPWKGPTQHGFPYTDDLSRAASLAVLPGTRIHYVTLLLSLGAAAGFASAQVPGTGAYYRCPGNVFTNTITAKEADAKGCKPLEITQPTTVPAPQKPRPQPATPSASRPADAKVDPGEQRARDSDARRILEAELKREEEALAALQKDFNNGEPERQGGERNYQKYLDRVEDMRNAIARKQADIAAVKRELAKLPAPRPD
jgi:hypothetical protein